MVSKRLVPVNYFFDIFRLVSRPLRPAYPSAFCARDPILQRAAVFQAARGDNHSPPGTIPKPPDEPVLAVVAGAVSIPVRVRLTGYSGPLFRPSQRRV